MFVVGITGGIGSGKTTVCRIFVLLGIPVFYADEEAKKLYDDKKIISEVKKLFGKRIFNRKGKVDKKKLGEIVFSEPSSLEKLNAVIHPEVKKKFRAWEKKRQGAKYLVKEAAIMIESGAYREVDYLISVLADEKERINRIVKRDNVSAESVQQRMREQLSDRERKKYSDAVIINDGKHSLIEQTMRIHCKLTGKKYEDFRPFVNSE